MWQPKICTGKPSAGASSSSLPVTMQQEKSRAEEITADRAARSNVLVISRTMPSMRLAMTDSRTGSVSLIVLPPRCAECNSPRL
jgi:hypothetical protein